jgi:PadR family transcriptional regulator, regulatory protein PadR
MSSLEHRDLLAGLVRLHILNHAAKHEIFGQWMIEELARHGYKLSPGTLYPILHAMEKKGYLSCRRLREGKTVRKLYSATDFGKAGLALARIRLRELTGEAKRAKAREEDTASNRRRAQGAGAARGLAAIR